MPQRKNASKSSSAEEARHMDQWRSNSGAKPGAPEGNTNGMRHGIYSNRFLSDEEKPMFESIIAQLYRDFVFNKSSDFMQVELVAVSQRGRSRQWRPPL